MTKAIRAAWLPAVMALAGCMVGPKYAKPPAVTAPADNGQLPAEFRESKDWKQAQPADEKLRKDWWKVFGSQELNDLEAQVDVYNQNLKVAEARFVQARTQVAQSRSALFPTVGMPPTMTTNRSSVNAYGNGPNQHEWNDITAPLTLSYEVDAWGRVRRSIAVAREEVQATAADLETIRLSMHAEMAVDYFNLRSLDGQKQLLDNTLGEYQKALDLVTRQFDGGLASGADVAQARTQLETTRAQAVETGVARAQYEHAIATLAGRTPESLSLAPSPLAGPPPVIPTGVPSQLLERRPDIAALERRMAEANERVGIAQVAFFPSLMVNLTSGVRSQTFVEWASWPSRFWSLGPNAALTLFDAGRRRAAQAGALAAYDSTVAAYRQSVLDAFRQVEDSISTLRTLEDEANVQHIAVQSAERSLQFAVTRYAGGLVTYLEVVSAQTITLSNRRVEVELLRRRIEATVLLIKALGGGWDVSQLPS